LAKPVLVIDQGTTSTRSIVFGADAKPIASGQREFRQIFPHPGWVEHDPEDIWASSLETMREALAKGALPAGEIAALAITNQRETALIWNRKTGAPIHNAIVWQDRRTADVCARLKAAGAEALVTGRTGLLLDPYFSATKIAWLLDNVEGARAEAERGDLAFGTVDTFLIWRLTGGVVHATDATNASRTSLYDIHGGVWDDDLLKLFRVPRAVLPEVRDTAGTFGVSDKAVLGAPVPILAVAGDQHAALIGQACLRPGMVKATFGTGAFVLLNTGANAAPSNHRMLTTVAYQFAGARTYALEGSIFSAGATVQWLRDSLQIIQSAAESGALAAQADSEHGVALVPAFAGLGAPHWDAQARGTIVGLTRGSTRKEIARAALESVGFQTRDLVDAMRADAAGEASAIIRVDGGMAASDWTMQFLADMLSAPVDRPTYRETTALGVAFLALWHSGALSGPDAFADFWRLDRRFTPTMARDERERRYRAWRKAVAQCRGASLAP
jgi:glycerol kinase